MTGVEIDFVVTDSLKALEPIGSVYIGLSADESDMMKTAAIKTPRKQ